MPTLHPQPRLLTVHVLVVWPVDTIDPAGTDYHEVHSFVESDGTVAAGRACVSLCARFAAIGHPTHVDTKAIEPCRPNPGQIAAELVLHDLRATPKRDLRVGHHPSLAEVLDVSPEQAAQRLAVVHGLAGLPDETDLDLVLLRLARRGAAGDTFAAVALDEFAAELRAAQDIGPGPHVDQLTFANIDVPGPAELTLLVTPEPEPVGVPS